MITRTSYLSILCICIGLVSLIYFFYLLWLRIQPTDLSFSLQNSYALEASSSASFPVRVSISEVDIDLPIIPATITDKKWETTTKGVSYLTKSPIPGEKGNSVLYGHNWRNLLGRLPEVKSGDTISISYADGKQKTFVIMSTHTVSPHDVSWVLPTDDKRLTIYTCTGFLDTKRFIAVAKLLTLDR